VARLAQIEGARRRGRPTKNSAVFIREHLPTFAGKKMWAGRPLSLRGGADGDVGAPGTAFIRADSRHSRLSVFHGRDGRAPFFFVWVRYGEPTLPFFRLAARREILGTMWAGRSRGRLLFAGGVG